jgi:hypothetical protein
MSQAESYIYILIVSSLLVVPLCLAFKTLLGLEQRIILPILRVLTEKGQTRAITHRRTPARPHPIQSTKQFLATTPAKFTQPRRTS